MDADYIHSPVPSKHEPATVSTSRDEAGQRSGAQVMLSIDGPDRSAVVPADEFINGVVKGFGIGQSLSLSQSLPGQMTNRQKPTWRETRISRTLKTSISEASTLSSLIHRSAGGWMHTHCPIQKPTHACTHSHRSDPNRTDRKAVFCVHSIEA